MLNSKMFVKLTLATTLLAAFSLTGCATIDKVKGVFSKKTAPAHVKPAPKKTVTTVHHY